MKLIPLVTVFNILLTKSSLYFSPGFLWVCFEYPLFLIESGNVFPVTESVKGADSLKGKRLKDGYDSHYVLVKRKGDSTFADVAGSSDKKDGDEIVIPSGSQCLPQYIVYFKDEFEKELKKKKDDIVTDKRMQTN